MSAHEHQSEEHETQPLKQISIERLSCLLRHWAWADEAKSRFERELASFPDEHARTAASSGDRALGAYYNWCAMLCAIGEAAVGHSLLHHAPLEVVRADLEEILPWLRVCKKRLFDVPANPEPHPTIADLHRDSATLTRLRRTHRAFGEAFRNEQVSREVDALDH
jgi:hypothetical protein